MERRAWQARPNVDVRGHDRKERQRVHRDVKPTYPCKNRFPPQALFNRHGVI
jgi:hypothetical protein